HERAFGVERLWAVCDVARRLADPWRVGRVIARPFVGSPAEGFTRTANRRDLTVPPPAPTLLDRAGADGREVISVGKIGDIFAHAGTGVEVKAEGNHALFDRTLEGMRRLGEGGLLVANFVDFDTLFGHRRDVAGYAAALEAFDARIPELVAAMRPGDGVVITADHRPEVAARVAAMGLDLLRKPVRPAKLRALIEARLAAGDAGVRPASPWPIEPPGSGCERPVCAATT
ncbi:MAG: phosphopentomutase, partial [Alphaproteobacteria bacterium]|nr:phosphopentomutase [Alphaproteobacteria bacterium]